MNKRLASSLAIATTLLTVGASGPLADWIATADEPWTGPGSGSDAGSGGPLVPAIPPIGTPGRGYALGGAHVMGIPYDEYIRRTGADWFPATWTGVEILVGLALAKMVASSLTIGTAFAALVMRQTRAAMRSASSVAM